MPLQDWGITGREIEPYYDSLNIGRRVRQGRQPQGTRSSRRQSFRGPACARLSHPALTQNYASKLFSKGRERARIPSLPAADRELRRSPTTNPDGMKLGSASIADSASALAARRTPKAARTSPSFRSAAPIRTWTAHHCWATKVLMDSAGRKATGVAYVKHVER